MEQFNLPCAVHDTYGVMRTSWTILILIFNVWQESHQPATLAPAPYIIMIDTSIACFFSFMFPYSVAPVVQWAPRYLLTILYQKMSSNSGELGFFLHNF